LATYYTQSVCLAIEEKLLLSLPGVIPVLVIRLQIARTFLFKKMSLNDIAHVVASHNISVHLGSTGRRGAVQMANVDLTNKILTDRTTLGSIVFIHADHDVAQ